jgi:hypothetical protein
MKRPRFSPALFALVCLSFLLPFATVSCDNAKTSFTGIQLATFTVPDGGVLDKEDCSGDISGCVESRGSWLALLAFAMALGGLGFGLSRGAYGSGWFATGGFLATLGIGGQAVTTLATTNFHVGFWLMLLLFFSATCFHAVVAVRRRRRARREPQPQPQVIV